MIASVPNGLDVAGIILAVLIAIAAILISAAERVEREWEREYERRQRRARWAGELEDVPEDWIDDLDELRRLPEAAA